MAMIFHGKTVISSAAKLSSRPERSGAEGPAVSFSCSHTPASGRPLQKRIELATCPLNPKEGLNGPPNSLVAGVEMGFSQPLPSLTELISTCGSQAG